MSQSHYCPWLEDKPEFCPLAKYHTLAWVIRYVIEEDFGEDHLEAIQWIVGLFNDCPQAEAEIFEFAEKLFERYAGQT